MKAAHNSNQKAALNSAANSSAPSRVRKVFVDEHNSIREKLKKLQTLGKIKTPKAEDLKQLTKEIKEFSVLFLSHLANEEKMLTPILKEIDAWGPARVDQMLEEHREQRRQIDTILEAVKSKNYTTLSSILKQFIKELSVDIEKEEKDFLNSEVLKDDFIHVGFSG